MFSTADRYWAGHLGCTPDELFSQPLRVVTHGEELAGYRGVLALFREGGATVSVPPDRAAELSELLMDNGGTPQKLAQALSPVASLVLGPAYLGYTMDIREIESPARTWSHDDAAAVEKLRDACGETAWEHGGSRLD